MTPIKLTRLALTLFSAALVSCSSLSVQTAKDPQADLSKYKTFGWADQKAETAAQRSVLEQTVKTSLEKELESKGVKLADIGREPDLLISYFGATREEVTETSPEYGYPAYPYYGSTFVTRKGSLTVQFMDAKSKRIVWQGTASEAIGDAGASQEQVAEAVHELMERYPVA